MARNLTMACNSAHKFNIIAANIHIAMYTWVVMRLEEVAQHLERGPRNKLYAELQGAICNALGIDQKTLKQLVQTLELKHLQGALYATNGIIHGPETPELQLFQPSELEELLQSKNPHIKFVRCWLVQRPSWVPEWSSDLVEKLMQGPPLLVPAAWLNQSGPAVTEQLSKTGMMVVQMPTESEIEICISMYEIFQNNIPSLGGALSPDNRWIWTIKSALVARAMQALSRVRTAIDTIMGTARLKRHELGGATKNLVSATAELGAWREMVNILNWEKDAMATANASMWHLIAGHVTDCARSVADVRAAVGARRAEADRHQAIVDSLLAEAEALRTRSHQMQCECDKLQGECNKLQAEVNSAYPEDDLRSQVDQLCAKAHQLCA